MDTDREDRSEGFVGRWSRLKTEARQPSEAAPQVPAKPAANDPPPDLPPLEKLTIESDFRGFFHPKVDEDVRRAALRKLFSDPHFNVMDGLDVYIDDYSKTEPIPAAMLASLKQAQRILEWAADKGEDAVPREAAAESNATPAAAALDEPHPDPVPQPAAVPDVVPSQKA